MMRTRMLDTQVLLKQIALPLFLTRQNKYFYAALAFTVASFLYVASNHYPLFAPQQLPMHWIDQNTPFIPETVWIYLSEYFLFLTVYFFCKDMVNANKYLYSFLALQTTSVLIFILWPTTYPRELFPLDSASLDSWTFSIFNFLRQMDTPTNCCPSLHVSSVYLSTFVYLDDQRKKFPFFFTWGTLIALSTLTTKQHYLIDVVMGFAMAVIFYQIFHRYIPYRGVQAKR